MDRSDEVAAAEFVEVEYLGSTCLPQSEGVNRLAPITDDGPIIRSPQKNARLIVEHPINPVLQADRGIELDRDDFLRAPHFPGVGVTQPEVGMFNLVAVLDLLAEDTVVIAQPIAYCRNLHGRQR